MAVVECDKCGRVFNDEDRSWNCPHRRLNPGMSIDLDPDIPDARSGHARPAPLWGVALAIAFVLALLLALYVLSGMRL